MQFFPIFFLAHTFMYISKAYNIRVYYTNVGSPNNLNIHLRKMIIKYNVSKFLLKHHTRRRYIMPIMNSPYLKQNKKKNQKLLIVFLTTGGVLVGSWYLRYVLTLLILFVRISKGYFTYTHNIW